MQQDKYEKIKIFKLSLIFLKKVMIRIFKMPEGFISIAGRNSRISPK
jgi:hypothetical protein